MTLAHVPATAAPILQHRPVESSISVRAIAYPASWRFIAALLITISGASLPFLLAVVLFTRSQPIVPLMLMRAVTIVAITPAVAAWLVARAFAVTLQIKGGAVILEREDLRVDVPCNAISGVDAWIIPLPGSGLSLRLQSGRRFRRGVQLRDPAVVLDALAHAGRADVVAAARRHPSIVYAHAKYSGGSWRWYHSLLKFGVFSLVPTLPLFRVKQLITYGGMFGQYYQLGLQPYVQSFVTYWVTLIIYLVLYAAVWRGFAETAALTAAWVAPSQAARVRRAAEIGCRVLYYGGVPALLIRFFLPW